MPKTSDVGVIVGRFQVHQLHTAHHSLLKSISDTHRNMVIVIGLSQARISTRNPLDFEARKQMVLAEFPNATVFYLRDEATDEGWSKRLDALLDDYLSPSQSVCLYGGRDSFILHYHGKHRTETLEPNTYISGTELRKSISKSVRGTDDFRAGVIWAAANGYARVFPTVDVAISRGAIDCSEWLFVKKPTEKLWRFCGGFAQPSDADYESAARREAAEETGAELGPLTYVCSHRVDDWRYRSEDDKIVTVLFSAPLIFGPIRPADDVSEAAWFQLSSVQVVAEHKPLLAALIQSEGA